MIYNTRNRSNDTTESQKEKKKVKLNCPMYRKQTNLMWSLKSLVTLKCESKTSLHVV